MEAGYRPLCAWAGEEVAGESLGSASAGAAGVRVIEASVVVGEIAMAGSFCEESVQRRPAERKFLGGRLGR